MIFKTLILGAGAGGMGPLVYAAGHGLLAQWLSQGVCVVTREEAMGQGSLGRYNLSSDSLATSFIEALEMPASSTFFADVLEHAETHYLRRHRWQHVPLSRVQAFLELLGQPIQRTLERHEESAFLPKTRCEKIEIDDREIIHATLLDEQTGREHTVRAETLVMAMGGRQDRADVLDQLVWGERSLRALEDRVVLTDALLTGTRDELVLGRLRHSRSPRVMIVGSSHSAYASAWYLLERLGSVGFEPGAITIASREKPRIYYFTKQAAADDNFDDFAPDDICPKTERIHRLGGLRGDGRLLWRQVTGRPATHAEERVRLLTAQDTSLSHLLALMSSADVLIPAFGYRPRMVPIFRQGEPLRVATHTSIASPDGKLTLAGGELLSHVYVTGLACGYLPTGRFGGEPSFKGQANGVWLYQHVLGRLIVEGVLA